MTITLYSDAYVQALQAVAKEVDLETQARIASTFTALELAVGHWHGFFHFRLLNAEQYAARLGATPSEVIERVRYGNALVQWWSAIGYPFIEGGKFWYYRGGSVGYPKRAYWQYQRSTLLHERISGGDRWHDSATANAFRRELAAVAAWAAERHPGDAGLVARLEDYANRVRAGRTRRAAPRCLLRDRKHPGQSCLLCSFPAPWELVADRYPGCRPPVAVGIRRGERQEAVARGAQVHRLAGP